MLAIIDFIFAVSLFRFQFSFSEDDREWFLFLLFFFIRVRDSSSTSSISTFLLDRYGEDGREEEEEVDKSSLSLISIGGFILDLVAFTFTIILQLVAYSLQGGFLVFSVDNCKGTFCTLTRLHARELFGAAKASLRLALLISSSGLRPSLLSSSVRLFP